MGIEALTETEVTVTCNNCEHNGNAEDIVVPLSSVQVYAGSSSMLYAKLPPCPKCGSIMFMFAKPSGDSLKTHMRRLVIKRAAENEQIIEGTPGGVVTACLGAYREFYDTKASAQAKDEYDGKAKLNLKVEKKSEKDKE